MGVAAGAGVGAWQVAGVGALAAGRGVVTPCIRNP